MNLQEDSIQEQQAINSVPPARAVRQSASPVRRKASAPRRVEEASAFDEEAPATGFKKYRAQLIVAIVAAAAGIAIWQVFAKATSSPAPKQEQTTFQAVIVPPPSTPPPPPPPPPPQQEQVKEEQKFEQETPQEAAEPEPAPAMQTGIKGPGAGTSGLGIGRGNGLARPSGIGGNAEKMKWSAYASTAQSQIAAAIRNHPKLRKSAMRVDIRVWPDSSGRISRATLAGSTGDPALDDALRNEVLVGLQLPASPPEGMPTPIVMRVTAKRP